MFTYIDPTVRERLLDQERLIIVNSDGKSVEANSNLDKLEGLISVLGPIPLPLIKSEKTVDVSWYACVRHTELSKVEQLAEELREGNRKNSFANLAS